jgi:hypothetical protein
MEGLSSHSDGPALGLSSRCRSPGQGLFMHTKPRGSGLPFFERRSREAGLKHIFLRPATASSDEPDLAARKSAPDSVMLAP